MAIDFTETHSNLTVNDADYRQAVEYSFIDRAEDLNEAFNELIDESLVETDRNFELHVMMLQFAGLNPYNQDRVDFFEDDDDYAIAILCDNGMLILGPKANLTLNWDEITYTLQYEDGSVLLHLVDNTDLFVTDENFLTIFNKLRDQLDEENMIPRFVEG